MRISFLAVIFMFLVRMGMSAEVSLAWDPSVSQNIAGYKIYQGNASRSYGIPIAIGTQTTYTVTGLAPGVWFFAVSAYDADGNESDFSNEVSTIIPTDVSSVTINIVAGPSIIQMSITTLSNTAVTIAWVTNVDCSGTILYGTDPTRWFAMKVNNLETTDHLGVINGLAPRTHYYYKAQSVCGGKTIESGNHSFNTK